MRTLSTSEINALQQQGCLADDWTAVTVADAFNPQYIRNVRFSGSVELGCFERSFVAADGFPRHSGIYNAVLHNCKVGDDCYIGNVRDHIANYNIGNDTFINNVGLLACSYSLDFQSNMVLGEMDANFGAIFENFAAQELHSHGYPLYYFNSKKQGELDFVIEHECKVLPIEIKSGKNYKRHNALSNVMNNPDYAMKEARLYIK